MKPRNLEIIRQPVGTHSLVHKSIIITIININNNNNITIIGMVMKIIINTEPGDTQPSNRRLPQSQDGR